MVMTWDRACNPLHGQTDGNKSATANIMQAAAVAVAGINTAMAIRMANLQYEIAKQYLDISKWWRSYYNNHFKPVEAQELAEVLNLTPYEPKWEIAIARAKTTAKVRTGLLAERVVRGTSQYCVGSRQAMMKDALNARAFAIASSAGMGQRNEQAKKDALDDRDWKWKEAVANRGRGLVATVSSFGALSAGIYGDLGKQARDSAEGSLYLLGYLRNRNETVYPQTAYTNWGPPRGNPRYSNEWLGMGTGAPMGEPDYGDYA